MLFFLFALLWKSSENQTKDEGTSAVEISVEAALYGVAWLQVAAAESNMNKQAFVARTFPSTHNMLSYWLA